MKDSLKHKLERLVERHQELAGLLATPEVISEQGRFRDLSREYAELEDIVTCFNDYSRALADLAAARAWADAQDNPRPQLIQEVMGDPVLPNLGTEFAASALGVSVALRPWRMLRGPLGAPYEDYLRTVNRFLPGAPKPGSRLAFWDWKLLKRNHGTTNLIATLAFWGIAWARVRYGLP